MQSYTPPLGTGSTKDYDRAIRLWTREKRWRAAMLAMLRPDWRLVIADYGRQHGSHAARLRLTVQRLDGIDDTQPNADGVLPA
jgi:hypothetical protein